MRQNSKFFFRVRELFNFHLLKHKMKAYEEEELQQKKRNLEAGLSLLQFIR